MTSTLIMSSTSMMQDAKHVANDQIYNSIRNVIQSIILQIYQSIVLSKQQQQLDNIEDNDDIIIDIDVDSIVRSIKEVLKQFRSIFTLKLIELGYTHNNNIMEILQQEEDNEQMIRSTIESFRMNSPTNNNSQFVKTILTTTLNQSNDICNSDTNNDDDDDDNDEIIGSKTRAATVTNNTNNNISNIDENNQNQMNITTTTSISVPFTAWAKLRQLGRDISSNQYDILSPLPESSSITNSSNTNNIQKYIDILDTYGYNNDTYWIYNQWKYIDQYTKEQIDLRLHYISPLSNVSIQQQQSQMKQLQSHNQSSSLMTNDRNNHNTLPVTTIDNTNDLNQQWDTKHLVSNALLSQHQNEYGQQQQSSSLDDSNTLHVENNNDTNQLVTTTTYNNNNYNETIQQLIDRKRKSLHKKRKWDTSLQKFIPKQQKHNNKKQMNDDSNNTTTSKIITLPEIPRYPSNDNGTTKLQWQHMINDLLLSDPNIVNDLNEYVHTNNSNATTQQSSSLSTTSSDHNEQQQHNTNDSNMNSLLIGSVCEIGQFHCYQQQSCINNNNNNRNTTTTSNVYDNQTNIFDNLSEKQKKQYQRKAIRTRLGHHIPIRATDEIYHTNNSNSNNTNKPWSRIVRTIATTKDNPIPYNITTQQQQQQQEQPQEHEEISNERIEIELLKSQYYFDFDLGYCTMELPTLVVDHPEQQHQSRTVYTFSSIEVLLHD